MPIATVEQLREHLQTAIELEHSTIPPYLCALYSIHAGTNQAAVEVVHSVFIEEMLHLSLAANLLNAIGGKPVLDDPRLLPPIPCASRTATSHSRSRFGRSRPRRSMRSWLSRDQLLWAARPRTTATKPSDSSTRQ